MKLPLVFRHRLAFAMDSRFSLRSTTYTANILLHERPFKSVLTNHPTGYMLAPAS